MPVKVVDASVLAALAFGEPRRDEAETFSPTRSSMPPTCCRTSSRVSPGKNLCATPQRPSDRNRARSGVESGHRLGVRGSNGRSRARAGDETHGLRGRLFLPGAEPELPACDI